MKSKYEKIWQLAFPYLEAVVRKDYKVHTQWVARAMEMLVAGEGGDEDILIPAAILHDTGWSNVPTKYQKHKTDKERTHGLRLHIQEAKPIIRKVLAEAGYSKDKIGTVVEIVDAHKFCNPRRQDKRMLIDADTLSDTFKEPFYSDMKSYGKTFEEHFAYRGKNQFYTKTAKKIFEKELEARKRENQDK